MEILVTVVLPVVLIWIVAGFLFRKMGGSGGPMGVGKEQCQSICTEGDRRYI